MESINLTKNIKEDINLKLMRRKRPKLNPIIEKQHNYSLKELCHRFCLRKSIVALALAFVKTNQNDVTAFLEAIQKQQVVDSVFELLRVGHWSRENVSRFCTGNFYICSTEMECDICLETAVGNFQLPCGSCCCLGCLCTSLSDNFKHLEKHPRTRPLKGDQIYWCPCVGSCSKQMSPLLVDVVLSEVCGLCGKADCKLHTVGCSHRHKFCTSCLSAYIQRQVDEKQTIVCPRFSQCRYHIPVAAVHRALDRDIHSIRTLKDKKSKAKALQLVKSQRAYAQDCITRAVKEDPFQRICPSPECSAVIIVPNEAKLPGAKAHACACPECARKWCSNCWQLAHPGFKCSEAKAVTADWYQFIKVHEAACGPQFRDKLVVHERQKKQAEETSQNTRRCPHCQRGPIFRIDGCPIMTCGRDAPDKDGVVRYSGCGKRFNWDRSRGHDSALPFALPYKIDVDFKPPTEPELLEVQKYGTHPPTICCSVCHQIVRGTLFACIQCPQTNLCWGCTRQMISCSKEKLDSSVTLSRDLKKLVSRGDISPADALKMMPELLSHHVQHTFKVVQPKRVRGVVVTASKSPPVTMLCTGDVTHVLFGKAFEVGSTWSYSLDDKVPCDFHKSHHGSEVYRLGTAHLTGDLGGGEKIEMSQITTALHLKFMASRKPKEGQVGALYVPGGAFIKDNCCVADFYTGDDPQIILSYDEITVEDARKHMGLNWKALVAATHDFKVWGDPNAT